MADCLVILGMINHEMGAPDAAIQFLAECLDLRTRGMGPRNEKVADVHAALGRAHRDLDHFEDAAKHYYRALNIIESINGAADKRIIPLTPRNMAVTEDDTARGRMASPDSLTGQTGGQTEGEGELEETPATGDDTAGERRGPPDSPTEQTWGGGAGREAGPGRTRRKQPGSYCSEW